MEISSAKVLFNDRYDAGHQLAQRLTEYQGHSVIVLAIPNGGVPVGLGIARALDAELDLVIVRKIPLPLNPEAGFGAVADDGTVILNEELVKKAGLSQQQINDQVARVRDAIRQRSLLYRKERPLVLLRGKTVIVTDDGLASGFTMKAAVESVRRRHPGQVVIAVPVASAAAMEQITPIADSVVTIAVGSMARFAVVNFYRHWHDLRDAEVIQCLEEWRSRRFGPERSIEEPASQRRGRGLFRHSQS
ncbi:MAG: phosphoribosyl transferase [Chloroflexi bacterium]|nr:phosphoribosyl transferase [Chloroflexota bacterium]